MMKAWQQWEGRLLNHAFVLGPFLGGSAHSAVFLTDYGDSRKAVVKLNQLDPDAAEIYLSRVESAAKLSHPNLLRLFDWGLCRDEDQRLPYVVMEYAEEDLSQVLPQRPLTPRETRDVLASALDALAYLHGQGFVHGRLKPANILAVDDQVKISSDFVCRIGDSARGFGDPGAYDPPEASRGEILPAGDIWTLALTMVEALTQRLPVSEGQYLEHMLPETIPEPFLDIARHCLQEDPKRRWPVNWVKARLTPEPPSSQRVPDVGGQLRQMSLGQYLPVATLGVVLGAVLIGSSLLVRHPVGPAASSANVQPPQAQPAREAPVSLEPKTAEKQTIEEERPSPFGHRAEGKSRPVLVTSEADRAAGLGPAASLSTVRADRVIHRIVPDVPSKARNTIHGKVDVTVEVQVDAMGNVVEVHLASPASSRYFADLALQAARGWKFAPAAPNSPEDASIWVLRFEFRKTETEVQVVPALTTALKSN